MKKREVCIPTISPDFNILIREPEIPPKGVIQINTGTCIPQRIYWRFAEFLTHNGYITITYDYLDAFNYKSAVTHIDWIKNIEAVFEYIIQHYPNEKKIMIGHSSGGQLVGYIKNCAQIDKLYLVASANGYIKNLSLFFRFFMSLFWNFVVPFSIKKYGFMNNKILWTSGGFPKNIILELRKWCFNSEFFVPHFKEKQIESYYHTIKKTVTAYHLEDDIIANRKSCAFILNLYTDASKSLTTLITQDYEMKKFGHRGFFHPKAEKKLWPTFLQELEK